FPRRPMVYTMARRDTVFNRGWKRWLMPRFGVFPISPRRGELDVQGVATVYQVLSRGGVVLVFPEGRYSRGRALRPLKKGVAHFALEAGVPICPVALSGLDRLRPFGGVEVSIGPPVRPEPPAWWTLQGRIEGLLERVRRSILLAFDPDRRERASSRWSCARHSSGRARDSPIPCWSRSPRRRVERACAASSTSRRRPCSASARTSGSPSAHGRGPSIHTSGRSRPTRRGCAGATSPR